MIHQPIARNYAAASENKIHSDEIAQRLGFTGALVPGVTVFGHLTYPVTAQLGTRWLEGSRASTRFLKPAYHGERLTISASEIAGRCMVEGRNPSGTLLATLECTLGVVGGADSRASVVSQVPTERVPISWDVIHIDAPFPTYEWRPDEAVNREYSQRLDDETAVFRDGVLHPHAMLSQANQALVKRFVMPAWIHTGSEICFRRLLRVGEVIEVRAMPIEKWEKKGHQFIKLYLAFAVGGEVATEIYHTAIFRVAGAG